MNWLNATVVVVSFCVVGCGTSEPPVNTKNPVEEKLAAGKEDLKKMLQSIADSGSGGSGLMGVKESIEKTIRPSDAKLADDLIKDFDQLSSVQDPGKIKEIAGRMVGKL